jgi:ABC-type Fe3+/spermidine/putrescine transport system ATPase subunit
MLAVKGLSFKIGKFLLKDINLDIQKNEYFVLLGRTGSGKTTLLKCICGLYKVTDGRIFLNDIDVTDSTSESRNIGYLPQNYALFPHLNVHENIIFGLKTRKEGKIDVTKRLEQMSDLLSIGNLIYRDAGNLSGGEKQRVALARALIVYPDILLLDEPFSSIDHGLKVELWFEVKDILKKLNITAIHITHNLDEAHAIADKIAVLINGKFEQTGSKEEIFLRPKTEEVALFQGIKNIYSGRIADVVENKIRIKNDGFEIIALNDRNFKTGQEVKFCIRPQDIKIIKSDTPIKNELKDNIYEGEIVSSFFYNDFCTIKLKSIVDFELRFPVYIYQRYGFHTGKKITVAVWQNGINIF